MKYYVYQSLDVVRFSAMMIIEAVCCCVIVIPVAIPVGVWLLATQIDRETWKPVDNRQDIHHPVPVGGGARAVHGGVASIAMSDSGHRLVKSMYFNHQTPKVLRQTSVWELSEQAAEDGSQEYKYVQSGQALPGVFVRGLQDAVTEPTIQSTSISGDGETIAIGHPHTDDHDGNGYVRVYRMDENPPKQWKPLGNVLTHRLKSEFGKATSLTANGRRLAVGVTEVEGGHSYVKVYDLTSNNQHWAAVGNVMNGTCTYDSQTGCLPCQSGEGQALDTRVSSESSAGEGDVASGAETTFGHTVSISKDGSRVAIGAQQGGDCDPRAQGFVRVFDWVEQDWVQVGQDIIVPELTQFDSPRVDRLLGRSLSLSGNGRRVAVGSNAGAVVLELNRDNHWTRIGGIINFDNRTLSHNEQSSVSISEDGSRVAVGAPYGNNGLGLVTVNKWNGYDWEWVGLPVYFEDPYFGRAVALSAFSNEKLAIVDDWLTWVYSSPKSASIALSSQHSCWGLLSVVFVLVGIL